MIRREYWVKGATGNFEVKGGGGGESPGENNFGVEGAPVWTSAGAITSWVYWPYDADPLDNETYLHVFHLYGGTHCIGPDRSPKDGSYLQGADYIFLQNNPNRPNRRVQVQFVAVPGTGPPVLKLYGRNWTKQEAQAWEGGKQLGVITASVNYLDRIDVIGVDVDANWLGQGYASYGETKGYKLSCIQIRAQNYLIKGCRCYNAGANSGVLGDFVLQEAFPINTYSLEAAPLSGVIEDCEVRDFHSANGGYATMICVNPFTAHPEPRPVI